MDFKTYTFDKQQERLATLAMQLYVHLRDDKQVPLDIITKGAVRYFIYEHEAFDSAIWDTFDVDQALVDQQDALGGNDSDDGNTFQSDYADAACDRIAKMVGKMAKKERKK